MHAFAEAGTQPSVQTASPYVFNAAYPFGTLEQKISPVNFAAMHWPGPHTASRYRSSRMPPSGGEHLTSSCRSLTHAPPGGGHWGVPERSLTQPGVTDCARTDGVALRAVSATSIVKIFELLMSGGRPFISAFIPRLSGPPSLFLSRK